MTTTKKITTRSARSGFSLVEILVVITILAALAAVIFPVAGSMMRSSKSEKNREMITIIERGIEDFYDKYNSLPIDVSADTPLSQGEVINLLNSLAGTDKTTNLDGKNFIPALSDAKSGRTGLIYASGSDNIQALVSSFGGDFNIILDADYDNSIQEPSQFGGNLIKGKRSLIWTLGEDNGDREKDKKHDSYSWQ